MTNGAGAHKTTAAQSLKPKKGRAAVRGARRAKSILTAGLAKAKDKR
jgi:hypothetical protein